MLVVVIACGSRHRGIVYDLTFLSICGRTGAVLGKRLLRRLRAKRLESAAPEGEQAVMKSEFQNLSNSDNF